MTRKRGTLHEGQYTSLIISRSILLGLRLRKSYIDNQNTPFIFNNFFRKSRTLLDNVGKCGRAEQAAYEDMAHAHCMLHT
jgi:hypothetical protein